MDEVIRVAEDLVPVLHEVHAVAMAVAAAVSEITQAAKPPLHDFAPVIRRSFSRVLRVLLEDSDLVAWDVADVDDMLLRVLGDARGRLKEVPMLFLRGRLSREEQHPASDEQPGEHGGEPVASNACHVYPLRGWHRTDVIRRPTLGVRRDRPA